MDFLHNIVEPVIEIDQYDAPVDPSFEENLVNNKSYTWESYKQTHPEMNNVSLKAETNFGFGELFLAKLMGGKVKGRNSTFDIETVKAKYEVKYFGKPKGKVRAGVEGIIVVNESMKLIRQVFEEMKKFVDVVGKNEITKHQEIQQLSKKMSDYITSEELSITGKGNFSESSMNKFIDILEEISTVKKQYVHDESLKPKNTLIKISDKEIDLKNNLELYVDIVNKIESHYNHKIIADDEKMFYYIFNILKSKFFDDPKNEIINWKNSISPNVVFKIAKGIFIVDENQFTYVESNFIDQKLKLCGISNMRPNYTKI